MIKDGLVWLEAKRHEFMSSAVWYRRTGHEPISVNATFGKSEFEVSDDYGARINTHVMDFLILKTQLEFEPKAGDIITANSHNYEVLNLPDGNCWRWSDPYQQTMRVHTKDIGPVR